MRFLPFSCNVSNVTRRVTHVRSSIERRTDGEVDLKYNTSTLETTVARLTKNYFQIELYFVGILSERRRSSLNVHVSYMYILQIYQNLIKIDLSVFFLFFFLLEHSSRFKSSLLLVK